MFTIRNFKRCKWRAEDSAWVVWFGVSESTANIKDGISMGWLEGVEHGLYINFKTRCKCTMVMVVFPQQHHRPTFFLVH